MCDLCLLSDKHDGAQEEMSELLVWMLSLSGNCQNIVLSVWDKEKEKISVLYDFVHWCSVCFPVI